IIETISILILRFIVARTPDVILLNEVKASDKTLADLTNVIGYRYVNVSSYAPNNRHMRGSAILYRMKPDKFTCLGGDSRGLLERNGAAGSPYWCLSFKMHVIKGTQRNLM
ncbi:hypothetical protein PMAYCL1PPCAC_22919, partial [Pristionchus mayeri]